MIDGGRTAQDYILESLQHARLKRRVDVMNPDDRRTALLYAAAICKTQAPDVEDDTADQYRRGQKRAALDCHKLLQQYAMLDDTLWQRVMSAPVAAEGLSEDEQKAVDAWKRERIKQCISEACWCWECNPHATWYVLCPQCGNKRCPKASHHGNACTGSNEPGQKGSAHE